MKIYIYTDYRIKDDFFESSRVRKNFKGFLETENVLYTIQNVTSFYNIAQYFTISDQTIIELEEKKKNVKNVLTLLYNEGETENSLYSKDKNDNYKISKNAIDIANMYDYIICPSELAKEFLINIGITKKIYVFNPGVKFSKFNLTNSYIKDVFYRVMGISKNNLLATSIIRDDMDVALDRIISISKNFKDVKFVVLVKKHNSKLFEKKSKKVKKSWKNIYLLPLMEEDVYNSLLYNSDMFINVNPYYSNVVEIMESMVSNTQIFSLKESVFEDIVIDKVNGYLFNSTKELIEGIKGYLNGNLPSLKEKSKEYAKQFSILTYGKELVKIYQDIERGE